MKINTALLQSIALGITCGLTATACKEATAIPQKRNINRIDTIRQDSFMAPPMVLIDTAETAPVLREPCITCGRG
ncbi:hypothetical protein DBR32_02825 [Taibaiella sp. KBW10]|uniref:hypothetical protein n=1 Tax=Taibaiella sp. KBW10 TaxID=2153357 RepID=UPI000F599892|nr:hypothetical protein [Taibaiella sp. KBW10]RQO32549.1 hypothetical protein DBR32_02825 [Taibaiella sp. KBW10]